MEAPILIRLAGCVATLCVAAPAVAQWSTDPATNLVLADRSGLQVEPRVAATSDGGAYVSWLDDAGGGYDVYLQRLDSQGVEQWPHNGILVADRSFASTRDYGLATDSADNALLSYRYNPGNFVGISAAKVSPSGVLLWGPDGVQLTSVPTLVGTSKITGTSDGNVVVAWTHNDHVVAQKLDPAGSPLWGAGVTMTPDGASLDLSDLHAAGSGTAILSMVHDLGGSQPRHVWAQKLDSVDGAPLWGPTPLAVYDAVNGSVGEGRQPDFAVDDTGGAAFAWFTYEPFPNAQARAQRISSAGAEVFPHNGVRVSTDETRKHFTPAISFDSASQETFVFWEEANNLQTAFWLYGQRLDAAGARQWTDAGKELVALGGTRAGEIQNTALGDGALVVWVDIVAFGNLPIRGARVDGSGDLVWTPAVTDLATAATDSSALDGTLSSLGFGIYAWRDGDDASADIQAQNLNPDGSLGAISIFADGFESGDTSAWSPVIP